MKRAGFTMIELIFVIVILGILAAVAIPKLAATRDDAVNSKLCANIRTCVTDAGAYYTATGNDLASGQSKACDDVSLTASGGSITVSTAPTMCSNLNATYNFGGTAVVIP